jgi:hypothetical protein
MTLSPRWQPWLLLAWVALLALFFAQVEIQIEGAAGWAAGLPTWRIEQHWLLDIFWGGRPMTGYHAWVFPFVALAFHLPVFVAGRWSWRLEMRIVAAVMLFWVIEDALWFVLNPAFGVAKLAPAHVPWHKHWWGPLPLDYWVSGAIGLVLLFASYREDRAGKRNRDIQKSVPSGP